MHSVIEKASRRINIWDQKRWCNVIKTSKRKNPYQVIEISQSGIFNFSELSDKPFWSKIKISQVSEINFSPNGEISYKYNYSGDLQKILMRTNLENLSPCYRSKLSIGNKKNDIQSLCDSGIIPLNYQEFYNDLMI